MLYGVVARAGALDAVERHDAVLERHFKLGFGLLHLLLANVGLAGTKVRRPHSKSTQVKREFTCKQ